MAHTYNGPGWDQEGARRWPFLSFTWKLLLAGVVEVLVDGGRDPTWHPPCLQVRPVSPNLRTTCNQASVILIQYYIEDLSFTQYYVEGVFFLFSLPILRKKKVTCGQPDAFIVGKFYAPAALVGSKVWPFWCTQKTRNPPCLMCFRCACCWTVF